MGIAGHCHTGASIVNTYLRPHSRRRVRKDGARHLGIPLSVLAICHLARVLSWMIVRFDAMLLMTLANTLHAESRPSPFRNLTCPALYNV